MPEGVVAFGRASPPHPILGVFIPSGAERVCALVCRVRRRILTPAKLSRYSRAVRVWLPRGYRAGAWPDVFCGSWSNSVGRAAGGDPVMGVNRLRTGDTCLLYGWPATLRIVDHHARSHGENWCGEPIVMVTGDGHEQR